MWKLWRRKPKEPQITMTDLADIWIESNRKAQQRFYDFLAERGAEPDAETIARDQARMGEVMKEAASIRRKTS